MPQVRMPERLSFLLLVASFSLGLAEKCVLPRSFGYHSCGANTAVKSIPFHQINVHSTSDCARLCGTFGHCKSIVVKKQDGASDLCELHTANEECTNAIAGTGFSYYRQVPYHSCVKKAPVVYGAARVNDNTYILFYEFAMQKFQLDYTGTLFAVDCPVNHFDFFVQWPMRPVKAVFQSDALGTGDRYYVVHGSLVDQYFMTDTMGFPTFSPPWPMSIEDFFGSGVSDDIFGVSALDDKFYVVTKEAIYVSQLFPNNTASVVDTSSPLSSPEFDWSSLTAATLTPDPNIGILFQGNLYFLYNSQTKTVVGKGVVCKNS